MMFLFIYLDTCSFTCDIPCKRAAASSDQHQITSHYSCVWSRVYLIEKDSLSLNKKIKEVETFLNRAHLTDGQDWQTEEQTSSCSVTFAHAI